MKLENKLRVLGPVDHEPLKKAVLALDPAVWLEEQGRQTKSTYHKDTQSVMLLMFQGDWPEFVITRRAGWERLADVAVPLMENIQNTFYRSGGRVFRAIVAKLLSGGAIPPHIDNHPSFAFSHRIHVPLVTNPDVEFRVSGQPFRMDEGIGYEISNLEPHSVANRGAQERLHFIFDYAEP